VAVVVGGRKRKKVDGDDRDLWIIVTKYYSNSSEDLQLRRNLLLKYMLELCIM
jgi:hypothetical protein